MAGGRSRKAVSPHAPSQVWVAATWHARSALRATLPGSARRIPSPGRAHARGGRVRCEAWTPRPRTVRGPGQTGADPHVGEVLARAASGGDGAEGNGLRAGQVLAPTVRWVGHHAVGRGVHRGPRAERRGEVHISRSVRAGSDGRRCARRRSARASRVRWGRSYRPCVPRGTSPRAHGDVRARSGLCEPNGLLIIPRGEPAPDAGADASSRAAWASARRAQPSRAWAQVRFFFIFQMKPSST